MYKIKLTERAAQMLKEIEATARGQILSKIEQLRDAPEMLGKALSGPLKDYRSVRAAGQRYRVIYQVVKDEVIVLVVAVGIRKDGDKRDIYELMKKLLKTGLLKEPRTR